MSTDNRTMLNDCEANTGWTGDDASTSVTNTGEFYQGSGALSSQFSDTIDEQYTTQDSVGATTFSVDLSDSTVYMLVKDNLGETYANGGMGVIIGDGTNRVGYYVGGNDATGIPIATFFNGYKLDVSVIVATPGSAFTAQAGSEASLSQSAVTQIGLQTHHLAKANGPSDNCFYDAFRYIANDSYALTINGGTSGTPETMADVVGDDITSGWGMVSNPVGDAYYFFAPTEWGEDAAAADHYFTATNEQWFWLGDNGGGHAVGATHFPMRVIGNATDTGSWVISGVSIVNTGTGAEFDVSSANMDTMEIDACVLNDLASIDTPDTGGTSRFIIDSTFNRCGLITHGGCTFTGNTIVSSTSASSLTVDISDLSSIQDCVFESDGSNHGIELTGTAASVSLTDITFTSYASGSTGSPVTPTSTGNEAVYVNIASGTVTLNVSGGTVPSVRSAGATVNVVQSTTVTLTGLVNPTEVRVYTAGTQTELTGQEDVTTGTYAFGLAAGTSVDIRIYATNYLPADILSYTIPGSNTSIPVQQIFDRNYNNP